MNSAAIQREDIFRYKGQEIESLRIVFRSRRADKRDNAKYKLMARLREGMEVELGKKYHSGMLIVNSPEHMRFFSVKINELFGETL